MDSTITLNISDPSDEAGEKQIATAIQKLVSNELTSSQAAHEVDATIIAETKDAKEPDLAGWLGYLWDCLGKSATQIPSTHSAQDRLIDLLHELQRLPKHQARQFANGEIIQKELWSLTPANQYEGFEQWLWELNEGNFIAGQQVEDSETTATAYINYSAFLARLLSAGLVEVTRLSALIRPSPFGSRKPSKDNAKQYGIYASAASQWILYAGEVLFEMCEKDTLIEVGRQKWTRALWESWKEKFDAVAESEAFGAESRDFAVRAARRMREIEREGVSTNVVEKFGFMSAEPEDDDGEVKYA